MYHCLTIEKGAAPVSLSAAPRIVYPLSQEAEGFNPSSAVENLKRSFEALGLSLHEVMGAELAVTGPHFPARLLPDNRSARVLLRQLRGVAA